MMTAELLQNFIQGKPILWPDKYAKNLYLGGIALTSGAETELDYYVRPSGFKPAASELKVTPETNNIWVRPEGIEPPFQG